MCYPWRHGAIRLTIHDYTEDCLDMHNLLYHSGHPSIPYILCIFFLLFVTMYLLVDYKLIICACTLTAVSSPLRIHVREGIDPLCN